MIYLQLENLIVFPGTFVNEIEYKTEHGFLAINRFYFEYNNIRLHYSI